MNRGMMRHAFDKVPSPTRASLRIKAPGTGAGAGNPYSGLTVSDVVQITPSQSGVPHLILGATSYLGGQGADATVFIMPFAGQLVIAELNSLNSDANFGFRYVLAATGCPYIDGLTLGTAALTGNIHIGSSNLNGTCFLAVGHNFPAAQTDVKAQLHVQLNDAGTNAVVTTQIIEHRTSGTPLAGYGTALQFLLQSSTTAGRNAGSIQSSWVVATDASRTNRVAGFASDSAADREVWRIEADGTAGRLAFFAATAVIQQATTGNVHTVTAGSTTNVFTNTTFDGSTGATAYTVGDIVKALKAYGLLAA